MYKNSFTRKNPGLFVFLVDQSGSMEDIMPSNGFSLAVNASEAVNTIIQESILRLTDTEEDGTEFVKQSLTVIIIGYGGKGTGYGNEWDYKAEVLCGETITDINSKYATKESQIAHEEMRDVLQPVFGGGTPMASAFLSAKEVIESWVQAHNEEKDPVPVLINITDGMPTDNIDELKKAVNDIKSLAIPDGNPLVLNIHITKDAVEPVKYPKDESSCPDKYSKLLFEISSEVSKDLIDNNAEFAKNSFVGGERLFMSNVSDFNALIQFVRLGTPQKKLQ